MITSLQGKIRSRGPFVLEMDVHGVGYEVHCTQETVAAAPAIGGEFAVLTRYIVREDSITLYGFASELERTLFDLLTSVRGIGPRSAMGILSAAGAEMLVVAIRDEDAGRLAGAPGIGKKTAERLIVELREKVSKLSLLASADSTTRDLHQEDAIQALTALGYGRSAAEQAVRSVLRRDGKDITRTEQLVRLSLMEMMKG